MDELAHRAVAAIYGAAADPLAWPAALDAIAACFDDVGSILVYGREDGRFGIVASRSLDAMAETYASSWSHRDIRALRARERGYFLTRDVITDRDVLSEDEIETDPQYAEFLAPRGLKWFAAASVSPAPDVEVALSVQRRADKAAYSEVELATLAQLARHVEASLRLCIRLVDTELLAEGLADALERAAIAVCAVDPAGRVVFANAAAKRLLSPRSQTPEARAVWIPSNPAFKAALERILAGDLEAAPAPVLLQRRSKADRPLVAHVLPLTLAPGSAGALVASARAIVLVVDPDVAPHVDPTLLRDLLGLTLAEARVAAAIGSGLRPRETAARLGLTESTVRSVLKRIFSKSGVGRQSELVALISRLASFGAPRN